MRPGRGATQPMPATHLSLHYHVVFATKNRAPLIAPEWRGKLHAYLGGTVRGLGAVAQEIGGTDDHVHLLVGAKATHRLADLLREIKSESSRWVHETVGLAAFAWQEGYGAFTVSASQRETVRRYIQTQEEHHRTRTFRQEYVEWLTRSGVEFDERFLD